jgi:hypothetical protein
MEAMHVAFKAVGAKTERTRASKRAGRRGNDA